MFSDQFLLTQLNLHMWQVQSLDVILEDTDIAKALLEYASYAAIENLILGASSRHGFIRLATWLVCQDSRDQTYKRIIQYKLVTDQCRLL